MGLEPMIGVLQTLALPTWLRRPKIKTDICGRYGLLISAHLYDEERAKRLELSTFSLARRRSTN